MSRFDPEHLSPSTKKQKSLGSIPSKLKKYYSSSKSFDSTLSISTKPQKLRPSDLSKVSVVDPDAYPIIINADPGRDGESALPIFQASPTAIVFQDYAPFATHEKRLYFRNNDYVARRIKIIQPDSPFFEVSAAKTPSGDSLVASKVAAGIEICYTVRFKPKDVRDYSWDLVCVTERESFVIPIRALGLKPQVTFPDEIDFGSSTVGVETRRVLLLKNTGSAVAKFSLTPQDENVFICAKEEQVIEPGASITIEVLFIPRSARSYQSDIRVDFGKGLPCFVAVVGSGHNVDVSISSSQLTMEPTYISLHSQRTLKIVNRSDIPVDFSWKSFASGDEDESERQRMFDELDNMEAMEIEALVGAVSHDDDEEFPNVLNINQSSDSFNLVAQKAELTTKYRNLRLSLRNDPMPFVDNVFDISPLEGQVWAQAEVEVTVTFMPDTACFFEAFTYLQISGREDRLQLRLNGNGVGAYAALSFDVLDIGDVFVNTEYLYEVVIRNKGDIPALWEYVPPNTLFGSKFDVIPRDGVLAVGESKAVSIRFECDVMGDVYEPLLFALQGNEDPLICRIKGSVIGPTFHFDCLKIDYGIVSFDYLHQTSIRMVNTSNISMVFSLSIPQDGSDQKKDFDITPSEGTLGPGESIDISVDFIPTTVKLYEYSLDVDVLGVGESLSTVPIFAECVVGGIKLIQKELTFGESFIRYPYERVLSIMNTSNVVYTKYEILPQLQYTTSIALYKPEAPIGFIEPGKTVDVRVQLIAQKIGSFRIALAVTVLGSKEPPTQISVSCVSIGPKLSLDRSELRWGNINCLTDSVKSITAKNDSLIIASLKMFMRLARSKFTLSSYEKILDPGESFQLDVTCNLDDSITHKDELYIVVEEGDHIMVPVSATGVGTTMFSAERIDVIDLGVRLSNSSFEKKFVLENRGRRQQQLHWYNKSFKDLITAKMALGKTTSRDSGTKALKKAGPLEPKFTIEPTDITLRPNTATTFTVRGFSANAGMVREVMVLESVVGKERAPKDIIVTEVICEVVDPLVEFSCRSVEFEYNWKNGDDTKVLSKNVSIMNRSSLPLNFVLRTDTPFNLSSFEHILPIGQAVEVNIDFYPLYRDDRLSHVVNSFLTIAYRGHPQRDFVTLSGEIQFPNLTFDRKSVEFGCVLNDATRFVTVKVTNTSKLDAVLVWTIQESTLTKPSKLSKAKIFDILPFCCVLPAGTTDDVRFSMHGVPDQKVNAVAICTVEGGPEYRLPLYGEASAISYRLDTSYIDFDSVVFNETGERDIVIYNTGKVIFPFEFVYSELSSRGIVEALPIRGTVPAGDKMKITVRIRPFMPQTFSELILLKIAHFDPVFIKCFCKAIFPCVFVNLPRFKRIGPFGESGDNHYLATLWDAVYDEAVANVRNEQAFNTAVEETPDPPMGSSSEIPEISDQLAVKMFINPLKKADISQKSVALSQDVEIQRLTFCNYLKKIVVSADPNEFSNLQAYLSASIDFRKVTCGTYVMDFGNVICGQIKKKSFRVTNASATGLLSWTFEHRFLAGSGFTIDPEKVAKLSELASVDLVVRFSAGKKVGRREVVLPLELKSSPSINIILCANVCLPEITLSSDCITFDKLQVGYSQKIYVKLTNISYVSAEWNLKLGGKDEGRFLLEPSGGRLLGRKSILVCVEFIPQDSKKYMAEIALNVDTNPKIKVLKLFGEGYAPLVRFLPSFVEFGPVLPFSKGIEQEVVIINEGEVPFEIFSVDFDQQYKDDEERLLVSDSYDVNGIFRWDASMDLNWESLTTAPSENVADKESKFPLPPIRVMTTPREVGDHQDYIVMGPPLTGVTTISHHLAKALNLPVRSIDEILTEIACTSGPNGVMARKILNISTDEEKKDFQEKLEHLTIEANESKIAAAEMFKKTAKGKQRDKEVPADVMNTPQTKALDEFLRNGNLNDENLKSFITFRLSWVDAGFGFVFDGVSCSVCTTSTSLEALKNALFDPVVIALSVPGATEGYLNRVKSLFKAKSLEEDFILKAFERSSIVSRRPAFTGSKSKKRSDVKKASSDEIFPIEELLVDTVPTALPVGDEPWFDVSTGIIAELDTLEYRALDLENRAKYLAQYRWQLKYQLDKARSTLARIREVYDPEKNILVMDNKCNNDSTIHKCIYNYVNYHSEVYAWAKSQWQNIGAEVLIGSGSHGETASMFVDLETASGMDDITIFQSLLQCLKRPKVQAPDPEAVPTPKTYKLIRRPSSRQKLMPPKNFVIVDINNFPESESSRDNKIRDKPKSADKSKRSNAEVVSDPKSSQTRWRIESGERVVFKIRFSCESIGTCSETHRFELVGTGQSFLLHCSGICDIPRISDDPRNVFMKRIKHLLPGNQYPSRRFVLSDRFYSFGPISIHKKADERSSNSLSHQNFVNCDVVRLTNSGRYACHVDLRFEDLPADDVRGVFILDSTAFDLSEGESRDVVIWAFPLRPIEYMTKLVVCVQNNPFPAVFEVRCVGVTPTVDFEGSWNDTIEQLQSELSVCRDKKISKDLENKLNMLKESFLIDFERVIVGTRETRSFAMRNTSLLPVLWELEKGELDNLESISFAPTAGKLNPGESISVNIMFQSKERVIISGKFGVKYYDAEHDISASAIMKLAQLRVTAESYDIQTVTVNSDGNELFCNEIDFGSMRVGDIAVQSFKIINKGKYSVGFKISCKRPFISSIIKYEPDNGIIEPGPLGMEIKLTLCCSGKELVLNGNKDVKVHLMEPISTKVVEEFALAISANLKYNRFRLLPSKGISFGAIRYDAEMKTKRVEISNEGAFELTYVVCPAVAETDELDVLDRPAFLHYAFNTPAAMRGILLGENYLERIASGGTKVAKKEGKGIFRKDKDKSSSITKSYVVDPDQIVLEAIPDDPLKLGAFNISPRIGIIQPGQTGVFDVSYDPQHNGISIEKLRICVTGVDPNDSNARSLQDFEINGESCFPAIVTSDYSSIFEEQEIISSLDMIEGKPDERVENLPPGKVLFAELERTLVFGPILCNQTGNKGAIERIRITNPTKIDVKVRLRMDIRPAAAEQKKSKDIKKVTSPAFSMEAFNLSTNQLDIPPHEHRFVSISFSPHEIRQYRAVFIAEIDAGNALQSAKNAKQGTNNLKKGEELTFDIIGSGTLPSIAVDVPTDRLADGCLLFDFHKSYVGKRKTHQLILRNSGVLQSTCLFDIIGDSDAFSFPFKNASISIPPGGSETIAVVFCPRDCGSFEASIKIAVLNNPYDNYTLKLIGASYKSDVVISTSLDQNDDLVSKDEEIIVFPEINLAQGNRRVEQVIYLKSNCDYSVRYIFSVGDAHQGILSALPSTGHLAPNTYQEVLISFSPTSTIQIADLPLTCNFERIIITSDESITNWNCGMKSVRPVTSEDLKQLESYASALKEYEDRLAKAKKGKSAGPPPITCNLELVYYDSGEEGPTMVYEKVPEPQFQRIPSSNSVSELQILCNGVADFVRYSCDGKDSNIPFAPTFMFQSSVHKITFKNECLLHLPVKWCFEELRRRGGVRLGTAQILSRGGSRQLSAGTGSSSSIGPSSPNPFSIHPSESVVAPYSSFEFILRFLPVEVDEFVYLMKGETLPTGLESLPAVAEGGGGQSLDIQYLHQSSVNIVLRGAAKRPICHFEIQEALDYLSRRPAGMKNEHGLHAPIVGDIKIAEIESIGLRSRNTFRFHVLNPTCDNFEFVWDAIGDPSPYWRCVYGAGTLFSGKRVEMIFEFLPEDVSVAESFFKFRLPNAQLEQIFLFSGRVIEPKLNFNVSKINFQSVMLGGEGGSEVIYIENHEQTPFNFSFEKSALQQFEGVSGPVLIIVPYSGTVPPSGKLPLRVFFRPQEEVLYNFNLVCEIKRKPTKLNLNIKGEGYAVHSILQLEQTDVLESTVESKLMPLREEPAVNILDFGSVKLREATTRKLLMKNVGKFNFEYSWENDFIGSSIGVNGAPLGGTLKKGEELEYQISFSPTREEEIRNTILTFTIAGKYTYRILPRGVGIEPALRFSFMSYDFDACFITSPGGDLITEVTVLQLLNQDLSSNISVECLYQKTASLWVDCPPSVIDAGATLEVPIRFSPRENKDYVFLVPFLINGSTKVSVNVRGRGIFARVELVNAGQRRINLGIVNVGSGVTKTIPIINRSPKAITFRLTEDDNSIGFLASKCISLTHLYEFNLGPRSTVNITLSFTPTRRIPFFSEDIRLHCAGVSKRFMTVSGKAQGVEVLLDSDSLTFGAAVEGSHKVKKLRLENTGDVSISYRWLAETFGPHFSISPITGKLSSGSNTSFDVIFKPANTDSDIRQESIMLDVIGLSPLKLTCTGSCIPQPEDSVQTILFHTTVRSVEKKNVRLENSTEKDWFLSPSLQGMHWSIPSEIRVPAKGSVDLTIDYYPLVMAFKSTKDDNLDLPLKGKIFIALPNGRALVYNLIGFADAPVSNGLISGETAAKRPVSLDIPLKNWLGEPQKLRVSIKLDEAPSPAVYYVAANAVEVPPHGSKDFSMRYAIYTYALLL